MQTQQTQQLKASAESKAAKLQAEAVKLQEVAAKAKADAKAANDAAKAAQAKAKAAKPKVISPYGAGLDLLCKNPNLGREAYLQAMKAQGFDAANGQKAAISTAYSQVRMICKRLADNGLLVSK